MMEKGSLPVISLFRHWWTGELPPAHTLHLAWGWGLGAGVSFLAKSSFPLPILQRAHLALPALHSVQATLS